MDPGSNPRLNFFDAFVEDSEDGFQLLEVHGTKKTRQNPLPDKNNSDKYICSGISFHK